MRKEVGFAVIGVGDSTIMVKLHKLASDAARLGLVCDNRRG